jgi:hypothetical protein
MRPGDVEVGEICTIAFMEVVVHFRHRYMSPAYERLEEILRPQFSRLNEQLIE